jgi:plastocyanin
MHRIFIGLEAYPMPFARLHIKPLLVGLTVCLLVSTLLISFIALRPYQAHAQGDGSPTVQKMVKITTDSQGVFTFEPKTLTIMVGTTVVWKNLTTVTHTVTSDTGKFDSGSISSGGTFRFKFTKAGTYDYHCSIHPFMTATIIVQ